MYDVVTIGEAYQDLFIFSDDFKVIIDRSFKSGKSLSFDYGAKIDIKNLEYHSGGSAVNSALCFAKIGFSVIIFTFVGQDNAAEKIITELNNLSIDTSQIKIVDDPTGTSIILSKDGDRTILSYHSDRKYSDLSITKNLKTKWFYLAPLGKDSDDVEDKIVQNIAKNGAGLIWNPGSAQIKQGVKSFRHLLRLCNILVLNREECLNFSNGSSSKIEDAMRSLNKIGAKIIVVTDGKNGAKCFDGEVFYSINITEDKRIDATGAGDAFASSFSSVIIKNCNAKKPQFYLPSRKIIEQSLKSAIIVSGSVVGKIGAHSGLLSPEEISDREKKLVKLEPSVYTLK